MEERLQKILAQAGIGSRRACEDLIRAGRVSVNGHTASLGSKANPQKDKIILDGNPVVNAEPLTYIAVYKPRGVISAASSPDIRQTVRALVPIEGRLYPVGRLDVDSEGLILLTNDGELTNRLMHPKHLALKVYKATLDRPIRERELIKLKKGVLLDGTVTVPDELYVLPESDGKEVGIAVHEGKNHLVRRIFEYIDIRVVQLDRYSYAGLTHHGLQRGGWRFLAKREVSALRKVVGLDEA